MNWIVTKQISDSLQQLMSSHSIRYLARVFHFYNIMQKFLSLEIHYIMTHIFVITMRKFIP